MKPYKQADRAIAILHKRSVRRFEKAKEQAAQLHFDELNVLNGIKTLYEDLEKDNEEIFLQLARTRYEEVWKEYGAFLLKNVGDGDDKSTPPTRRTLNKSWLIEHLRKVDPVTTYIYMNEIRRKRDYLVEAVNGSKSAKRGQYLRGLSRWTGMTQQYVDNVSDTATLQAFEDMGIDEVQWVTQEDEKTCSTCGERNGKIYPIDNIPDKPHRRCRCYITPVKR